MTLTDIERALSELRLSGIADRDSGVGCPSDGF